MIPQIETSLGPPPYQQDNIVDTMLIILGIQSKACERPTSFPAFAEELADAEGVAFLDMNRSADLRIFD